MRGRFRRSLGCVLFCLPWLAFAQPEPVVVTYSTNPGYPPYHWAVSASAFDGASIELLELIRPAGVTFKALVYPWKRALALAADGQIDMLLSLRKTPEREEFLNFVPHRAFANPIAVFVREDRRFRFGNWNTLQGRQGGYSAGDTFGGGFDEYWRLNLTMEGAPSMENNFRKLLLGRIDYFVTGYYTGMTYVQSHPDAGVISALQPMISDQPIHFAFSKKSAHLGLMAEINRKLEELDRKGVPDALLKKHLERFAGTPPIIRLP